MVGTPGAVTKDRKIIDGRQRMWNSMRVHKSFTSADIQATAEVSRSNVGKYLRALHTAGYLRQNRPRQSGKPQGHAVWMLVRNSGPKRPIPRDDQSGCYDPNLDCVFPYHKDPVDDQQRRMA